MHDSEQAWVVRRWLEGPRQTEIASSLGLTPATICTAIYKFATKYTGADLSTGMIYGDDRKKLALKALKNYFLYADGVVETPCTGRVTELQNAPSFSNNDYHQAKCEHAWLLRAEGLTFGKIGDEHFGGLSRERVRQMVWSFGRRVQRATRRTRAYQTDEITIAWL